MREEAEDHSTSENEFMTSKELGEKYATSSPDQKPSFPGGNEALSQFISENLQYPSICMENGIQGKVIVQFIVTREGDITDVIVAKGVDSFLDKEAVRVVSLMPKWEPAVKDGQFVNCKNTLPITFRLN